MHYKETTQKDPSANNAAQADVSNALSLLLHCLYEACVSFRQAKSHEHAS